MIPFCCAYTNVSREVSWSICHTLDFSETLFVPFFALLRDKPITHFRVCCSLVSRTSLEPLHLYLSLGRILAVGDLPLRFVFVLA